MLRYALSFIFLAGISYAAVDKPAVPKTNAAVGNFSGTVSDTTGAIIAGAQVAITDATGVVVNKTATDNSGEFYIQPPHQGDYTLTVSIEGFQTVSQRVHAGATAGSQLSIALSVAAAVTQVDVNSNSNVDLTASGENGDTAVMSSEELKSMPVFDNDYVSAMGSFLDSGEGMTGGPGLIVDGVETNRMLVSASSVEEVHINQDPYSAQYYYPGRGQIEIVTKQAADAYHGQLNFIFRDAAMNAQQDFSPSKPPEQRRIYEGSVTGPLWPSKKTSFLLSFTRAEEDLDAVVNATVAPTPGNPKGIFNENVPAPTRDTEFSMRIAHQFSEKQSASVLYAFQDSTNRNQGVGNQTLPEAGYNTENREDDVVFHDDYIYSPSALNQASIVLERVYNPYSDVHEGPKISVAGNYTGGSAQFDQVRTSYNLRVYDTVSWTKGSHNLKFGAEIPNMNRRVLEDRTNSAGTYVFGSTYADKGTLIATALENYQSGNPSEFSIQQGQTRYVYRQQEVGAFVQDQIRVSSIFSVTPGLRYDWQNYLADDKNTIAPRLSFALVLDKEHAVVLRGGGGVYYDRPSYTPIVDLARYGHSLLRQLLISANQQPLCYPIANCVDPATLPATRYELEPGIETPYQIDYGISVDRKVGEKGTISIGGRTNRGVKLFRSIDMNAPLPPHYVTRPNPTVGELREIQTEGEQNGSALDINYRGRFNRYFTGFAWYSWSHYDNDTGGIFWFPQNQFDPDAEWGPASWDQRNRFGFYGMFNPEHLLNLGVGVFANSGKPWTITTGEDFYGTGLFNARPEGVPRDSETGPDYADLDVRWGYDFKLRPKELDKSPTIGVSASAFNVLNHANGSYVDTVGGSKDFGHVTNAYPPRRMQLAMRFVF